MANFSVNQVRQFYAVNAYAANVNDQSAVGTIGAVKKVEDHQGDQIIFFFKGADSVLKSDYITIKNIGYAKAIAASEMVTPMIKKKVVLNPEVNGGNPVQGQDYVLGINFKGFFSPGEGSQYYKDAAVHATSGMSKSDFYKAMVKALNAAFSRESGATKDSNPYLAFSVDDATTATKIIIEEKEQEWQLGTKKQRRIMFDVFPGTVYDGTDDVRWATQAANGNYFTEETPTTTIGNGKKVADLEWFCAGERGDQYRMVGWPHVINTTYLTDASKEYHLIEIHYAFTDTGVNSYRTEKELTIAVPKGAGAANYTAVNGVIGAINTAAGSTIIATLS